MSKLPNVRPYNQRDEHNAHEGVEDVGHGIQSHQPKHSAGDVEDHGQHKDDGGSARRFEDVLALIVCLKLVERFL